jgi:hypothetical protein
MRSEPETGVGSKSRTRSGASERFLRTGVLALAVALATMSFWTPLARSEVVNGNVARFEAVPPMVNLNRNTSIEVEIFATYGAGMDDYRLTVIAPDASSVAVWYNFSAVGTMAQVYGDAAAGFMTAVTQVGIYALRLEYFDGITYRVDGVAELEATDRLDVVLVLRSASNPATDKHSCPVASELVRGAKFIGGANIYFASTGEAVTDLNSDAVGNITGAILGETHVLHSPPLWHSAFYFPWDAPTGAVKFYVNASDGRGNFGSAVTGSGTSPRMTIVPDTLVVSTRIRNGTGPESVLFAPGNTIRLEVEASYTDHAANNFAYVAPLNGSRGGQVTAHIGWGAYNVTSGMFENTLTNLTLTLDTATQTWVGTYQIPASTANTTGLQAVVTASDGASPPNTGSAFTSQFAIRSPPVPQIIEVPVEVPGPSTGFEAMTVGLVAAVLLVVGLGIGFALSRMRGKKPEAPKVEEP